MRGMCGLGSPVDAGSGTPTRSMVRTAVARCAYIDRFGVIHPTDKNFTRSIRQPMADLADRLDLDVQGHQLAPHVGDVDPEGHQVHIRRPAIRPGNLFEQIIISGNRLFHQRQHHAGLTPTEAKTDKAQPVLPAIVGKQAVAFNGMDHGLNSSDRTAGAWQTGLDPVDGEDAVQAVACPNRQSPDRVVGYPDHGHDPHLREPVQIRRHPRSAAA